MKRTINSDRALTAAFYVLLTVFSIICLVPIVLAISGSLSTEVEVATKGFSLLPRGFTLDTYKYVFDNQKDTLLGAYTVTIVTTLLGTGISVVITTCFAYVISVKDFRHANKLAFFAYFTMLFNGGMLPWYLVRNYIRGLPNELTESAKIDGAGYFRIFWSIVLPLSKAGIVTIVLFYALTYWNDFYLPLMLVTEDEYFSMQYILYKMNANIQYLATNANGMGAGHIVLPTQTIKMAITCIAIGPIALVYPFVQKYFVKGVTVGALKG